MSDERLMPTAVFYDADLYRTTPQSILTASAMNGFDKGVESLYTRHSTAVTDRIAVRGLRLLQSGFPTLREDPMDADDLNDVLAGIALVQYGVSMPGSYKLSIHHPRVRPWLLTGLRRPPGCRPRHCRAAHPALSLRPRQRPPPSTG